jgi:hypothetical protein
VFRGSAAPARAAPGRPAAEPCRRAASASSRRCRAGPGVRAWRVAVGIARKVSKYRALAQEAGLPLIVAAGADKFTGLELRHLDDLFQGVATVSVQFDFGDSFIHHPVEIDPLNPPRWTMPPELAGLLWVNNDFPFTGTWRPNPSAERGTQRSRLFIPDLG